jgi:hypothetical protein
MYGCATVKDQIHPICKISVPFCAFPPPSGFRSIPLWLGVVGGVLNNARLSIHDARFYNLLYVKSQRHCDTASRLLAILGLEIFDARMNSLSPDLKSQLLSGEEFSCHDAFMPNSRRIQGS